MKRTKPRKTLKHLQRGVFRWLPILALPFCMLFFEVWLQLHIYQNDYEKARLAEEMQQLEEQIDALQSREADLQAFGRLESYIPELDMVAPQRSQITVILPQEPESEAGPEGLAYARLEQERDARGAGAPASATP